MPLNDGLPVCDSFIFEGIAEAYRTCSIAKYAHVIVVKSLTLDAPSFILGVLGTDSKYDHRVIVQRWKFVKDELLKRGIVIVSNGADGTGPFLKAMIEETRLFTVSSSMNVPPSWTFYLMPDIPEGNFYSQDGSFVGKVMHADFRAVELDYHWG